MKQSLLIATFTSVMFMSLPFTLKGQTITEIPAVKGTTVDAQNLSYFPDARYAAVFIVRDTDCKYSNEQLKAFLLQRFRRYDIPVKFVEQEAPDEGTFASFVIWVNGHKIKGNLSNRNFSIKELSFKEDSSFEKIKEEYKTANPDFSPSPNINSN